MSRGIQVVYLMSGYDKLMQRIDTATAEFSSLASTVRELQLSHGRLHRVLGRVVDQILNLESEVDHKELLREAVSAMEQAEELSK